MNFSELKQEVSDRGFSMLSDTRLGRYVNVARADLDRAFLWPWREASATGTAPLAIANLGQIEAVVNKTQNAPLSPVDFHTLLDNYGDLSLSGTPSYYYVGWSSGTPQVATYPTSSDTIGVQYWKVAADLSGTNTPISPSETHYLIVDMAVQKAQRDSDNHEAAAALQPEIDRQIGTLLNAYPPGQQDGPDAYVGVTYASEDW